MTNNNFPENLGGTMIKQGDCLESMKHIAGSRYNI